MLSFRTRRNTRNNQNRQNAGSQQIPAPVRRNIRRNARRQLMRQQLGVLTPNQSANQQAQRQPITQIGRALRTGGALVGKMFGLPGVGASLGSAISRVFGQGDYVYSTPAQNSLMSANVNGGVPAFSPLTSGFRLQHREYITDVKSSVDFSKTVYQLNPGSAKTFPWLSALAANFEEYKVHGMVVYLNTMSASSVASTNTALGLWGVVTQYDPNDPDFFTKQQCENYVGAQTSVPSKNLIHGIECMPGANVLTKYFVRDDSKTFSGEDQKFYDMAKITVFTQGSQAISTIGEMWISYDIEFTKPRLTTSSTTCLIDKYHSTAVGSISMFTNAIKSSGSNLGTYVPSADTLVVPGTCPDGLYLFVLRLQNATAVTTGNFPVFPPNGWTLAPIFGGNLNSVLQSPDVTASGSNKASTVIVACLKKGTADMIFRNSTITAFSGAMDCMVIYGGVGFTPLTNVTPNVAQMFKEFSPQDVDLFKQMLKSYRETIDDINEHHDIIIDEGSNQQ